MQKRPPSSFLRTGVSGANVEDIEGQLIEKEQNLLVAPQQNEGENAQGLTKRVFALYQAERKARRKAEELNRVKDGFLAAVSHELRTPLTAILGWSLVLRGVKPDEAAFTRGLDAIERSAHAQEHLLEDLLDVMRIKTGKLRLHVKPVELLSIIHSAIDTLQPMADSKHIRLQCITSSNPSFVLGDQSRLNQIMWNLLLNAIKFTSRGGDVLVQLERVDSHMEVKVTDTGEGISPDFLPHVFEMYRQRDGSTRDQGLGLGLAIVNHLVKLHHGTVRAESNGKEHGACFTVRLPVIDANPAGQTVGEATINKKGESGSQQIVSTSLHSTRKLE